MKTNKKMVLLVLFGLFLLTSWFYWFQYRPIMIRQYCHNHAEENAKVMAPFSSEFEITRIYDRSYEKCLHEKGFK